MPGPGPNRPPVQSQRANLKSKRLVYIQRDELFRFVGEHPYTCVQYVTYGTKQTEEAEPEAESKYESFIKPKMPDELTMEIYKHNASTVRYVQYFNCAGYEFGEKT